jgi:DNA polymerase-1
VNLDEVPITAVRTVGDLPALAAAIARARRIAVDTETHAAVVLDNGMWAALRVVSVGIRHHDDSVESFVVDVRDVPASALAPVMAQVKVADAWNAKFDNRVMLLAGCDVQSWRDAMHLDGILHTGMSGFDFWHSLAYAAKRYLGVEMTGKGTTQVSYDGESDLTDEQWRYPGVDAVITLLVAEEIDRRLDAEGLRIPAENEVAGRPFLFDMETHGLPFESERWKTEVLQSHQEGKDAALREIADLTGGAEVTLFGESDLPTWNVDSDPQLLKALNTYAVEAVKKHTGGRLLEKSDKLDKTNLKQIGHPLTKAVLKYKYHSKVLSTYGDNLDEFIAADGRIRPEYKQGGITATGRLSSDKPNAQNFSPLMKPFFRPGDEILPDGCTVPRAFVYADLSQAELRVLAQTSEEERMRELFRMGGDFHARTAADMFQVDMDTVKVSDPEAYSNHRKKAKGVNFGIPYGLGAAALATNLTVNSGLATGKDEAAEALKRYAKAYPMVDAWLAERDGYVKGLAKSFGLVDWDASLLLFELVTVVKPAKKRLRRVLGRPASAADISVAVLDEASLKASVESTLGREPSADELAAARDAHITQVDWAMGFDASVVLRPDGTPWFFESRSMTGRRRVFNVPMDSSPTIKGKFEGVITSAVLQICTSDNAQISRLRDEFAAENGITLPSGTNRCPQRPGEPVKAYRDRQFAHRSKERVEVIKAFEGDKKRLKYALVKFMEDRMVDHEGRPNGRDAVRGYLLPMAMTDQIRSMGNKFRNHPIQSLVADVGLEYYAELHRVLKGYRNAFPVQAVHDSIAIECDLAEAPALMLEVKRALETALARWCPDVPAVADADIRLSLSDDDVVAPDDVPALLAQRAGALVPA